MADEEKDTGDNTQGKPVSKLPSYEELVQEEPEREINLDDYDGGKTLTEEEEGTEQKTDIQAILKVLTPRFPSKRLNDLLQPAMVSRIFPDNLLDKNKLIVLSMLQDKKPDDCSVDVVGYISMTQDGLSIGYEGRGIIDRLEIAGVAHEQEMDKLSKELGLG